MNSLTEKAYAKINLTLDITGKLPNGYHELASVMQTVSLCDDVTVALSDDGKIKIFCDVENVPIDESNTCYKAAKLYFERLDLKNCGAHIHIIKRIPSQAGLGGGSSDAAAVLRLLNKLCGCKLSDSELCDIAAKVGADVPFLLFGGTALCEGIGEKLTFLSGIEKYKLLLVKPCFGFSTPGAYKAFNAKGITTKNASKALVKAISDGIDISPFIANDLERANSCEKIDQIKQTLIGHGALNASMTGSGSCVYGLFEKNKELSPIRDELRDRYGFAEAVEFI